MFQRAGLVPVLGMVLESVLVPELVPEQVPELGLEREQVPELVLVLVRHRRQQ